MTGGRSDPRQGPATGLTVPDLGEAEREAVAACVAENWISTAGPEVNQLERSLCQVLDRGYAAAMVNSSASLHLALLTAGVRAGDAVALPDLSGRICLEVVRQVGGRPVVVDVDAADWTMSPEGLEAAFAAAGGSLRAVVAHALFGRPVAAALAEICRRHGAVLIEMAECGIGNETAASRLGTVGDIGVLGFGRLATLGGGGAVCVTDDSTWAESLQLRSVHRLSALTENLSRFYFYRVIGFNVRLTNVAAGVCLAQLGRREELVARQAAIDAAYREALVDRAGLRQRPSGGEGCVDTVFALAADTAERAARLVAALERDGIAARRLAAPVSTLLQGAPRYGGDTAASLAGRIVLLPSGAGIEKARERDLAVRVAAAADGSAA